MRGKGYVTEAVRLLVGWLFSHADATRIHVPTVPDKRGHAHGRGWWFLVRTQV
jgi:hypothetical protein